MRLEAVNDVPLRSGVKAVDIARPDVRVIFRACEVREPEY